MLGLTLSLFPDQASQMAVEVDRLYFFLIAVTVFFSVGIAIALATFAYRYRRNQRNLLGAPIEGSLLLEITWTAIPFAIAMLIFAWGANLFIQMSRPPDDAMEIFVVGKQWMWKVQHMEGRREINEIHVPSGRAIKLTMTSEDVIHSFYIPAFRVKGDVVPGRYNTMWFEPTKTGTYHLFCAEYCGTEHSRMIGKVVVMEPAAYQAWLAKGSTSGGSTLAADMAPVELGEKLFADQGCVTCHMDGNGGIGPRLTGIYGTERPIEGGTTAVVDDAYLRESILNPMAKLVDGYEPVMPTFQGRVSEEELMSLVLYLKSLSNDEPQAKED